LLNPCWCGPASGGSAPTGVGLYHSIWCKNCWTLIHVCHSKAGKGALLVTIELPSESWFYTYWRWFQTQPDQGQASLFNGMGGQTGDAGL
jgi:hypothetical protein